MIRNWKNWMITMAVLLFMGLFGRFAMAQQIITGTFLLSASATDVTPTPGDLECGVGYVQFYLSGNAIGPLILPDGTDNYKYAWDSTSTPDGDYILTAKATDRAGTALPPHTTCDGSAPNTATSSPMALRIVNHPATDTTPPSIIINPPIPGAVITNKTQLIQVTTFDPSGIGQIQLRINGSLKSSNSNQQVLSYQWNTNPYKGTVVNIDALSVDKAGNSGSARSTVSVRK